MAAHLVPRLEAGEDPISLRNAVLADTSWTASQQIAGMIVVQEWWDRVEALRKKGQPESR